LKNDISETTNLADQYPGIVKELQELGERAREDLGDEATGRIGKGVRPSGLISEEETDTN
jgi:hypothetical protein